MDVADVEALLRLNIGDTGRLNHIKSKLESGSDLYKSDREYLERLKGRLAAVNAPTAPTPEEDEKSETPAQEPQADTSQNGTVVTTTKAPQPRATWYLMPIFLGILGGLIAFAALRKRNRGMAYKNLGVGVGITMILPALVLVAMVAEGGDVADLFSSGTVPEYTDEEIRGQAVTIPYQSLVDNPDAHDGELVYYEGTLIQVKNQFLDEYILRVGVTPERFSASDVILLTYTSKSDEEKKWLDRAENELRPFQTDGAETITFWGISRGITEYNTVFGQKISIPAVDAIIIERHSPEEVPAHAEPQGISSATPPDVIHSVGYSDIPGYVDVPIVELAVIDAVQKWNMANPDMDFTIAESDADVTINWARYLPGSGLGLHHATVADNGTRQGHTITVRLGIDDCRSEYRPFAHGTLQYVIAHEIGHYLGLRHIDDKDHLMYSEELFNVDAARVYDNLNLNIPRLERPDIATTAGLEIQHEIDMLNAELERVQMQRQELRDAGVSLDDNTAAHNDLVQKIQELEDRLLCANIQ